MAVQIGSEFIHTIKVTKNSTTYSVKDIVTSSGTHIWCLPPNPSTEHTLTTLTTTDGTQYTIGLRFINNSTKSVTYTFNCAKLKVSNISKTLTAGQDTTITFGLGSSKPLTSGGWTVTYLGESLSFTTVQKA